MAESFEDYNKRIAGAYKQPEPSAFHESSQILGTILTTLEQEETAKRKKLEDKFDMYKTLREAGYDTKAAFEAMQTNAAPASAPSQTTKEEKDKLDIAKTKADIVKTEADTQLTKEKSAAYARGDMAKRQSNAEKMNAAQLQREIKRMSDPFENPDYDSEETKSYLSYLNSRLQQLSQYPGAAPAAAPAASDPLTPAAPLPAGKIRVKRKSDGQMGTISAKNFDPKKYERA